MTENEHEEQAVAHVVLEALGGPERFLARPFEGRPAAEEQPVRGGWGS